MFLCWKSIEINRKKLFDFKEVKVGKIKNKSDNLALLGKVEAIQNQRNYQRENYNILEIPLINVRTISQYETVKFIINSPKVTGFSQKITHILLKKLRPSLSTWAVF